MPSSRRSLISRPGKMTVRMTGSTIGCIIALRIGTSITRQREAYLDSDIGHIRLLYFFEGRFPYVSL